MRPDPQPDHPADEPTQPARRRALRSVGELALAAAALPAWAQPTPAVPAVRVMLGFADQQTASLWVQGRSAQSLRVDLRRADGSGQPLSSQRLALEPSQDCAATVRLVDLDPGTEYRYRLVGEEDSPLAEGRVRTQPLWVGRGEPPPLRLALGSCAYLNDGRFDRPGPPYGGGEAIFDSIAEAKADLMLWLGDNIYLRDPEWSSREGIARRYRYYREHPSLQKLLAGTPHIAIWDDHDFGPNDADASFVNGPWTRELFQRYWPVPYATPPGALYGMVSYGDVDIFMLDDRSVRDPHAWRGEDKQMYGATQLRWLLRALVASRATFKLVAGGSQFFNAANRFEGWNHFPQEQKAFQAGLLAQRVGGVMFLSGDRHFAELLRIERPGSYPLLELTTSPLTASPVRDPGAAERGNPDVVPGTFYNDRNFALLNVSGPRNQRVLQIELKDTAGKTVWEQRVAASALRPPREGAEGRTAGSLGTVE